MFQGNMTAETWVRPYTASSGLDVGEDMKFAEGRGVAAGFEPDWDRRHGPDLRQEREDHATNEGDATGDQDYLNLMVQIHRHRAVMRIVHEVTPHPPMH
jgi:hypothetical protein